MNDKNIVRLESVATFLKGKGISKNEVNEEGKFECIRYGELYTKYGENISDIYSKTNYSDNPVTSIKGDILIPSSGETAIDLATASRVDKDGILLGGDINIIRPASSKVNSLYLSYQLNSSCKNEITKLAQGSSVIHIYNDSLKKLKVDIPDINKQEKIGKLLSSMDQLIEYVKEQSANISTRKSYILENTFNDSTKNKECYELAELVEVLNGLTGKNKDHFNKEDSIARYVQFKNIHEGNFKEVDLGFVTVDTNEEQNMVLKNDILLTGSSENIEEVGTTTICNLHIENLYLNSFSYILRVNKNTIDSLYLHYLLKSKIVRKKIMNEGQGITRINISPNRVLSIKVGIEKNIENQKKIAKLLSSMDQLIDLYDNYSENLQEQKKYNLNKIFS